MYTRVKTEEQLEKEEYYSGSGLDPEEYLDMVSDEDLTPRDVRTLIRAEEELSQCHNYTRFSDENGIFKKIILPALKKETLQKPKSNYLKEY